MSYAAMLDAYTGPSAHTPPLRVRRKSVAPPDFRRIQSAAPTPVAEPKRSRPQSVAPAELKKAQRRTLSADSRLPTIFANLALPPTFVTMSSSGSPPKAPLNLPDEAESPERNVEALILELRSSLSSSQTLLHSQAQRLTQMSDLETELSQLKDQHAFVVAAKEAVENDLRQERKKREAAEETIQLLRGQVDQARRGVGMLQKQEKDRKRMSQIPHLPPGGFGPLMDDPEEVLEKEPTSKASKRTSFIGRTHRRASSNSEPDAHIAGSSRPTPYTSPNPDAPKTGGLRELRLGSLANPASGSALVSPIGTHFEEIAHPIPPGGQRTPSSSTMGTTAHVSPPKPSASEEEAAQLRHELNRVRGQLAESEENRIASEACLKALRDFMASGGEDAPPPNELLRSMRLPPLPSDPEPGFEADDSGQRKTGWGFKLWRGGAPASPPASTTVEPPRSPEIERDLPLGSTISNTPKVSPLPTPGELPVEGAVQSVPTSQTPLASFVSGWTKGVVPGTPADRPTPGGRKLTNFFSRGGTKKDEKDLPAAPENEGEAGGEGLDPSPEIVDLTEGQESKRSSGEGQGSPERKSADNKPDISPKSSEGKV